VKPRKNLASKPALTYLLVTGGNVCILKWETESHSKADTIHLKQQLGHPFNGLFPGQPGSADTRKVKPFRILMKPEMMQWQQHQLDHMQIICTSFQTDIHASTSLLKFLPARCSS